MSALQRVFNVMACRDAVVAWRWDGWSAAQRLPQKLKANLKMPVNLPLRLARAGPEYPTSKKDLTKDSLFEKSSFIKYLLVARFL